MSYYNYNGIGIVNSFLVEPFLFLVAAILLLKSFLKQKNLGIILLSSAFFSNFLAKIPWPFINVERVNTFTLVLLDLKNFLSSAFYVLFFVGILFFTKKG